MLSKQGIVYKGDIPEVKYNSQFPYEAIHNFDILKKKPQLL